MDSHDAIQKARAPLRTYSKRRLKEAPEPPPKRRALEGINLNVASSSVASESVFVASKQVKKSRIEDYFRPPARSSPTTTSSSTGPSSDPVEPRQSTPPSSPPVASSRRTRRRLQFKAARRRVGGMGSDGSKVSGARGGQYLDQDPESIVFGQDGISSETRDVFDGENELNRRAIPTGEEFAMTGRPTDRSKLFLAENLGTPTTIRRDELLRTPPLVVDENEVLAPGAIPIPGRFVQTRLTEFVGAKSTRISCKQCGMLYDTADENDAKQHEVVHLDKTDGPSVRFQASMIQGLSRLMGRDLGNHRMAQPTEECQALKIRLIDGSSPAAEQAFALRVVNSDLTLQFSCKPFAAEELWATILNDNSDQPTLQYAVIFALEDMYMPLNKQRDSRVVGAVLVERICTAYEYREHKKGECKDSNRHFEARHDDVLMGVSRIFVRERHRREKLGTAMLDASREKFIFGTTIERNQVAFTRTTTLGRRFARGYTRDQDYRPRYEYLEYD